MAASNYWKKREEENLRKNLKTEAEYAKEIERIYRGMMDDIQKDIDAFYGRYASKEGISISEAKKRVSKLDIEEYGRKAKRYVKEKNFSKQANEEMRLYNLTMKVNRLELLKAQIGLELVSGFDELQQYFEQILTERSLEEFKRQAGILGDTVSDTAAITSASVIAGASFYNATFSDRIWMHQDLLKAELAKLLRTGLVQGRNPRELARQLRKVFNTSKYNAERLMRTEMARVQTEAQRQSYERNDFEKYKYIASHDMKACEICKALDGKAFDVSEMTPGENAPPMHPNCVLPDTKIIAPDIEAITRSEYSGEVVEIGTPDGTRLSVTPNHIMLTARGWVRAKNIVEGDKIIRYCSGAESVVESNPTNNNRVTTIEELFAALVEANAMPPLRVPVTAEYLKGDVVPDSEVDVIFINSELRHKLDSPTSKLISDVLLVGAREGDERSLASNCSLAKFLVGAGLVADGIVSGSRVASILLGGSVTHHELVGFRRPSDYDSRLFKTAIDNGAADAEFLSNSVLTDSGIVHIDDAVNVEIDSNALKFNATSNETSFDSTLSSAVSLGDLISTFSGFVSFDDVAFVSNKFYSGHVYDTSCSSTLYICNGILSSNCRCSTAAHIDDKEYEDWLSGYKEHGMSFREWREKESTKDAKHGIINKAKANTVFTYSSLPTNSDIRAEGIFDELNKTRIGKRAIQYMDEKGLHFKLSYRPEPSGDRAYSQGDFMKLHVLNNANERYAAAAVVHELTHHYYNTGGCQRAEVLCYMNELRQMRNIDSLTISDMRYVIGVVKDAYDEFEWRKGGYFNGKPY